jgi:hypothetical protein
MYKISPLTEVRGIPKDNCKYIIADSTPKVKRCMIKEEKLLISQFGKFDKQMVLCYNSCNILPPPLYNVPTRECFL